MLAPCSTDEDRCVPGCARHLDRPCIDWAGCGEVTIDFTLQIKVCESNFLYFSKAEMTVDGYLGYTLLIQKLTWNTIFWNMCWEDVWFGSEISQQVLKAWSPVWGSVGGGAWGEEMKSQRHGWKGPFFLLLSPFFSLFLFHSLSLLPAMRIKRCTFLPAPIHHSSKQCFPLTMDWTSETMSRSEPSLLEAALA